MTSKKNIISLYRESLRLAFDWILDGDEYRKMAVAIRREFDRNKGEHNSGRIALLYNAGQYLLWKYRHPEPYHCIAFAYSP